MRTLVIALALLGWTDLAAAQSPATGGAPTPPHLALPLPPIGLPLAPIGLPLPRIGLPPPEPPRPASGDQPPHGDHEPRSRQRRLPPGSIVVYYGLPGLIAAESTATPGAIAAGPTPTAEPSTTGRLRVEVEPYSVLQLFVDGVYVGTPEDVGGELELEAGTRRIEMRAEGFEAATLDVRIIARQSITYRGALTPDATPQPAVAPAETTAPALPVRRQTFYFIPGCYLGNIPPDEVKLPPGCDLSRLVTRTP